MTRLFAPVSARYAVLRLNAVEAIKPYGYADLTAAAENLSTKKYLIYFEQQLALPFPDRPWYPMLISPIAPCLAPADEERGLEPDMCIPIFPNAAHPSGREAIHTEPRFPYGNCYHWSHSKFEMNVRVRHPPTGPDGGQEEWYDDDAAVKLSVASELVLMRLRGEDFRRAKEAVEARSRSLQPQSEVQSQHEGERNGSLGSGEAVSSTGGSLPEGYEGVTSASEGPVAHPVAASLSDSARLGSEPPSRSALASTHTLSRMASSASHSGSVPEIPSSTHSVSVFVGSTSTTSSTSRRQADIQDNDPTPSDRPGDAKRASINVSVNESIPSVDQIVQDLVGLGVFGNPNEDFEMYPLADAWFNLRSHLPEQEHILNPRGLYEERAVLVSLIRDARRRKEEEEAEEAEYKFRLAVSPHRSIEDDEKGAATHERTVLQTATSAATHSTEDHESTRVRPPCQVLRTCVWQIKKMLSMAKHSVRLP